MNLKLKIWRQKNAKAQGEFKNYTVENISPDTSFLEMLDILNNDLIHKGEEPIVFDHDCREGICGMCSLHINGHAHGPDQDITTCQLHMRKFKDGDTIVIEPWRSKAFPVIKDLAVDRSAFDKILQVAVSSRLIPVVCLMQMLFLFLRRMPMRVWMQRLVSVAVHALLPARTVRLCCS